MSTDESLSGGVWHEISTGVRKQRAVIMAIVYKDFRAQLGKSRLGLVWVLLEPMVGMVMLSALWYMVGRLKIDGFHVTLFITTGIIPYMVMRAFLSRIPMAFRHNAKLFDYPLVKPIDALLAKSVHEISLLIIAAALLMFALGWFLNVAAEYPRKLELIGIFALLCFFGLGLSLLIAVYSQFYESIQRSVNLVTKPLIFVSGVMYSINDLPNAVRAILSWNPLVHFIEFSRVAALGSKPIPELSLFYIASLTAITFGLGVVSYYVNRFRLLQR